MQRTVDVCRSWTRPRRTSRLCCALVALGAATTSAQEAEGRLVRWHDVRALGAIDVEDPEGVDLRLHQESSFLDELEPDRWDIDIEDDDSLSHYGLDELVIEGLGPEWPDRDAYVDLRGGFLRVEGSADTQREVETILAELTAQLLQTADLEVYVFPSEAVPAGVGGVLDPGEIDALIAAAEPLDYSRTDARVGHRVRIGSEAISAALLDYDVEVAQMCRVGDPQVTVMYEGLHLGAIARTRLDGGIFLRVWGRRGELHASSRSFPMENLASAPIDLPATRTTLQVGSAVVPDGGGLLLSQGWSDGEAWLIRATLDAPPRSDSPFVPLGELTTRAVRVTPPELPRTTPSGGWDMVDETLLSRVDDDAFAQLYSADDVLDQMSSSEGSLDVRDNVLLLRDSLYVRNSDELRALATETVRGISAAVVGETVELELRLGLLDRAEAAALASGSTPAQIAEALPHRVVGACRVGDCMLQVGGVESYYLQDHDVEIAHGAAIPDPIVNNLFTGTSFWCRPNRVDGDSLATWIELTVHEQGRPTTQRPVAIWEPIDPMRDPDGPYPTGSFRATAALELPSTSRATMRTMLRHDDGAWALVGCAGLSGSDRTLVAAFRAVPAR